MSDKTIFQILNASLHDPAHEPPHRDDEAAAPLLDLYHEASPTSLGPGHLPPRTPPLRLFAKLLNLTRNTELFDLLDKKDSSLTLLAPDDFALRRVLPPRHHHPEHPPPSSPHPLQDDDEADFESEHISFWGKEAEPEEIEEEAEDVETPLDLFEDQSPSDLSDLFTETLNNADLLQNLHASSKDNERVDRFRRFL